MTFEAFTLQKEGNMESWERHYAKLKNNKWQMRTYNDGYELDEDEKYLQSERNKKIKEEGLCLCPNCDVLFDYDINDPVCPECGWDSEEDSINEI